MRYIALILLCCLSFSCSEGEHGEGPSPASIKKARSERSKPVVKEKAQQNKKATTSDATANKQQTPSKGNPAKSGPVPKPAKLTPYEFQYVSRPALDKSEKPPLLIALHGYGANANSLFKLVSQLDKRLVVVSARGPYNHQRDSYFWFNIDLKERKKVYNTLMGKESIRRMGIFIDQMVKEHNADPNRVYLMGFSQGAMMAHATAMRFPNKVKGIMLCSGGLFPGVEEMKILGADYSKIQTFISHGTADRMLSINHAEAIKKFCEEINMKYDFHFYGGAGHGINQENADDLAKWITKKLGKY